MPLLIWILRLLSPTSQVIDSVTVHYKSVIEKHGGELVVKKLWTDSWVNAVAERDGDRWIIKMYGGLARRPEVDKDAFAMVVCHELGHHLGGYPFKYPGAAGWEWASSEGQSDHFASQACARKIWGEEKEDNASFSDQIDLVAKRACDQAWAKEEDRHLCYRISKASLALATLLASGQKVSFDTPSKRKVSSTRLSHPPGQCRLDTYLAGALCKKKFDIHIIPGLNHPEGINSVSSEEESAIQTCTRVNEELKGARPRCWYKPQIASL